MQNLPKAMRFSNQVMVAFWCFISTPLTNMCRASDSKPKSQDNLRNVEAFNQSEGWSPAFPMQAVSMMNWPFTKSTDTPMGVTAQEYVDMEMVRRAAVLKERKSDTSEDGLLITQAFEDIFCNEAGELNQLTLENAFWVHSGHQRTEFVFVPAYTLYLQRKAAAASDPSIEVRNFSLEVPCSIGTYGSLDEILRDQMSINSSASNQNKLNVKDYFKSARRAIGRGAAPNVGERDFRNWCSAVGGDETQSGNGGKYPRQGYLLAICDYTFPKSKFYDSVLASPTVAVAGQPEPVNNPEYIDLADVSIDTYDPTCDISVIARICEQSLDKLTKYNSTHGDLSKAALVDPSKSKLSGLERAILARGKAWTPEEFDAWCNSKKRFGGSYHLPVLAPKTVKPEEIIENFTAIANSTASSDLVRSLFAEKLGKPIAAGEAVPTGTIEKALAMKDQLDVIFKSSLEDETDMTFLGTIADIGLLRDGDKPAYVKLVSGVKKLVDKATEAK